MLLQFARRHPLRCGARSRHLSVSSNNSEPIPLQKVLVANRGEIACRVLRTCRQWGIPTVAIYSSADGPDCLHATMADEAYMIGTGPAATDSYLQADAVLEIAKATGADAIHPGYGFLSENAAFSAALSSSSSIQFIGPPPEAITAMGNKSESKRIMEAVGVPVTPGYHDDEDDVHQDADVLYHQAVETVGFPLLIKAVSGGGGKGMRLVQQASDFRTALDACQRESLASFGDARVLLERYLVKPRHVEVQIVADTHGNCVHLFERDCSLQRRHQKILEEAPASDLPMAVRQRLGEMGTRAAQGVGYVNAGTVEFLLDTADPEQFYFCEMNTRLQVEHPITEMITGIDLVEWQLRVAAGQPLPIAHQDDITCHGHAFEARIYAEDPDRNFMPATGTVWHHQAPAPVNSSSSENTTIRVDSGIQTGQEISVYYDPMISKLIVHGENRITALDRLESALRNYHIAGVPTNLDFLVQCVQHPVVRTAGAINTGFLEDHPIRTASVVPPIGNVAATLAVLWKLEQRTEQSVHASKQPWSSQWGSQRLTTGRTETPLRTVETEDCATVMECRSNRDGSFMIQVAGDEETSYHVSGCIDDSGDMELLVNNALRLKLKVALHEVDDVFRVCLCPQGHASKDGSFQWSVDLRNPMRPRPASAVTDMTSGDLRGVAPMPGKITRVEKEVGDEVEAGDVVVVLEAMKMEHTCLSPATGLISELRCEEDDIVGDGAVLFVIEKADE